MAAMVALILLIAAVVSTAYSALLERIHDVYAPDFIWVTVVIGNGFIFGTMAVFATIEIVSWGAVWLLFLTDLAWGVPVIIWQLWQAYQRRRQRTEGK